MIKCKICDYEVDKQLSPHLTKVHNILPAEYKNQYQAPVVSEEYYKIVCSNLSKVNPLTNNLAKRTSTIEKLTEIRKGMKFPPEWCRNMSLVRAGKTFEEIYRSKEEAERQRQIISSKIGELAPNWRGGLSLEPYGEDFNGELHEYIWERDNYTCQICRLRREQLSENLSVHHIDYIKKHNNELNLISLCRKCHSKTHPFRDKKLRNYWKTILGNKAKLLCLTYCS